MDLYETVKKEFETYKNDQAAKETAATTERLFRAELTALGITGKRADAIVRATDLTGVKVKDGALEDAKGVQKSIKDDWAEFIPATHTEGANTPTPPANNGGSTRSMSRGAQLEAAYHENLYGAPKKEGT